MFRRYFSKVPIIPRAYSPPPAAPRLCPSPPAGPCQIPGSGESAIDPGGCSGLPRPGPCRWYRSAGPPRHRNTPRNAPGCRPPFRKIPCVDGWASPSPARWHSASAGTCRPASCAGRGSSAAAAMPAPGQ